MHLNVNFSFFVHLGNIKKYYHQPKNVKPSLFKISKPLNDKILDLQMSMIKLTMKMQAPKAMAKPFDVNIMTILRPICKG
jgi:hypothetical protein